MSDMTALMPLAADETPPPPLTVSGLEVSFGAVHGRRREPMMTITG
jgi:hypothetical protein